MFAKVENGKVISAFVRLPGSYGNVSGFNNLPAETLRTDYGIYPLEEVRPALAKIVVEEIPPSADGEDRNRYVTTEAYGAYSDAVQATKVVRTYAVLPRTVEDINYEVNAPLDAELEELDIKKIRPMAECLAALIAGEPLPLYGKAKFADLNAQAEALRGKRKK